MTLLYGLTATPASQPRNAVLGQIVSLVIAICIGYADKMELRLRQSLATALAIDCMVKLGLTPSRSRSRSLNLCLEEVSLGKCLVPASLEMLLRLLPLA